MSLIVARGLNIDRTGDFAGLGALVVAVVWLVSAIGGLLLLAASFLLREKHRHVSLVGLLPLVLVASSIAMSKQQEHARQRKAATLRREFEQQSDAALERFRGNPHLLEAVAWNRATNSELHAMERLLSSGDVPVEGELLARLYAKDHVLRLAILKRPNLSREFLEERFDKAWEEALDGSGMLTLELMAKHPNLPNDLLKKVALDEAVPGAPLMAARERLRRQAGMTEAQIFMARESDRTGENRMPNDVLPAIAPWVERERRRLKLAP